LFRKSDRLRNLPDLLTAIYAGSRDDFGCTALLLSLGEKTEARTGADFLRFQFTSCGCIHPESDDDPITNSLKTTFLKTTTHTACYLSAVRSSSHRDFIICELLTGGALGTVPHTHARFDIAGWAVARAAARRHELA
jgi:hypothetical protein